MWPCDIALARECRQKPWGEVLGRLERVGGRGGQAQLLCFSYPLPWPSFLLGVHVECGSAGGQTVHLQH